MWEQNAREEAVFRKSWSSQDTVTLSTVEPTETGREKPQFQLIASRLRSSLTLWVVFLPLHPSLLSRPVLTVQGLLIVFYTSNRTALNTAGLHCCFSRAVYFWVDSYVCVLCGILRATVSSAFCRGIEQIISTGTVNSSRILRLMSWQPGQGYWTLAPARLP